MNVLIFQCDVFLSFISQKLFTSSIFRVVFVRKLVLVFSFVMSIMKIIIIRFFYNWGKQQFSYQTSFWTYWFNLFAVIQNIITVKNWNFLIKYSCLAFTEHDIIFKIFMLFLCMWNLVFFLFMYIYKDSHKLFFTFKKYKNYNHNLFL